MTALAQERSFSRYGAGGYPNQIYEPQKGTTKIWCGAMVMLIAGYAAPAAATAGGVVFGVSTKTYDNTAGADGAMEVVADQGVFPFANSAAGDAITQADAGKECFVADDQTVAKTSLGGTRPRAGTIVRVDGTQVWVFIGIALNEDAASTAGTALVYAANDAAPANIEHLAIYDVPTTAAASTVTLPAAAPTGTRATFSADGTKNGHTVTYRDATGAVALTTALLASKRHSVIATKLGAVWTCVAYVSP